MKRALRIRVRGSGLAALTAAKLLVDRGADVIMEAPARRRTRILAVAVDTLILAAELFELDPAELAIGPTVSGRRVDWSDDGPGVVPQAALVCRADALAAVLARPLRDAGVFRDSVEESESDWTIEASGHPAAAGACGGARVGYFARIADVPPESTTSITATQDGWIFTAPHPDGGLAALVIAPTPMQAAATPDELACLLGRAGRKVPADAICEISRSEPVAPRLSASLCGAGRIVVGESALALDPLRGDGTGFALRGALLAQAVLAAIENGYGRTQCMAHYENRLRSAFLAHLRGCSAHYRAARHAAIWERDIASMDRAAAQADVGEKPFKFRLEGVSLVPVEASRGAAPESCTRVQSDVQLAF